MGFFVGYYDKSRDLYPRSSTEERMNPLDFGGQRSRSQQVKGYYMYMYSHK